MRASDHVKTIREALDAIVAAKVGVGPGYSRVAGGELTIHATTRARAALDSLEAELAEKVALASHVPSDQFVNAIVLMKKQGDELIAARERIVALEAELTTLRARLAPADTCAECGSYWRALAPADSPPGDEELRKAIAYSHDALESSAMSHALRGNLQTVLAAAEAHLRSQQPETEEQRAPLEEIETLRSYIDGQSSAFALSYDHHASDALSAIEAYIRRRTEPAKARDAEGGK